MKARPRVKICGVRTPDAALLAADLGADFLGLNFYPPSPRYVEPAAAAEIAAAAREHDGEVRIVGVFVNRPAGEIEEIAGQVGLDLAQFHGDEQPADLEPVAGRAIRAFRVRERIEPSVVRGFEHVWGYLFDYRHPSLYGGSGESWDFSSLDTLDRDGIKKPIFIAGGLGPDNVRAALAVSSPWGIDVCSGVESAPGRKDPELLRRLFEEIAISCKEMGDGQSPITS